MNEEKRLTKKQKRALAKEKKQREIRKRNLKNKLRNTTFGLSIVFGMFFVGYRFWKWINTPAENFVENTESISVFEIVEGDNVKGNKDSAITIIEYSDFQCPACANYSALLKQVVKDRDDVQLVFRHFPLT